MGRCLAVSWKAYCGEERTRGAGGDGSSTSSTNSGASVSVNSCTQARGNGHGDSCNFSETDTIVLPAVVIPPLPTASRESGREPEDALVQFKRAVFQMDHEREAIPHPRLFLLCYFCRYGIPLRRWQQLQRGMRERCDMPRKHLIRGLPVVQREPHRDVLLVRHIAHYNGSREGWVPFWGCGDGE